MKNKNGGKVKKGNNKSRGYIGYHTTWTGSKVFLRSKVEFIYARTLDHQKIEYKVESMTYCINGKNYKPDFFLYNQTGQLYKIVETKGWDAKAISVEYKEKFAEYFLKIGVEYEVVWKYQRLVNQYNLQADIQEWVKRSITDYEHVKSTAGEHNSMYGKKHTLETKALIAQKARQRQTPEYREMNSKKQKAYWSTEEGKQRRELVRLQKLELAKQKNPIVVRECKQCQNSFTCKQKSTREFCNGQCSRKWNFTNTPGYGQHKKKINKTKN